MLRRLIVFAALAAGMSIAAAITLATPALAKGPSQARITGPGLARPIVVSGNGEPGQPGILGTLALQTKLFSVMFGPNVPEPPQLRTPPAASLGPRYTIVYTVYGEFTRPGQQFGQIRQTSTPERTAGRSSIRHKASPGGRCRSPDGSGPVATCPAPLPSSAFHRVRAHRQPPRPISPLPHTQWQRSKRAHEPLPGSSHQPQPLPPQRSPVPRCGCVTAGPPPRRTAPNWQI
jgi:hypothetical protein